METKIPLEPEHYYHIYNHATGDDNFFTDKFDYQKFLDGYVKYLVPICDTFSYCFMPNHFHFFVQIKSENELIKFLKTEQVTQKVSPETISYRFSHFFNGYAQAYNKKYRRKGTLFRSKFGRKPVETEKYFVNLVHYIHSNPVKDRIVTRIEQWEYSSYNLLLSDFDTFISKTTVFEHFGNIENFKLVHQKPYNNERRNKICYREPSPKG